MVKQLFFWLTLCALINFAQAQVIHQERSLYRNILVEDQGDLRCLKFNVKSTKTQQSCLLKSQPERLVFNYTKLLMSSLLFMPDPKRILVIGLGGGTMSNTFAKLYPESKIDNVEIDQAVIKVARDYFGFFENNFSSISLYLQSAHSLKNKDIKLSERITIPSNRLRGFESGRVGPKDGDDFIGGNYAAAINFSSTIPQILENSENIEFLVFLDAANVWGVDYFNGEDEGSEIRSSFGIGIDWLTPVGPLSFTLAEPITKSDTDKTESFRFNLGTTF